jgi:RNA polymerase sigma-70 factor (ECF subfamily)
MNEAALFERARGGDENAFAQLMAPYRGELHAHCYRMLGSVQDAEDALQEALLRAWRGLERFQGRSSLRSWLYTICTNSCLRAIERRPRRVLPIDYGPPGDPHDELPPPLTESVWVQPYPDELAGPYPDDERGPLAPDSRYEQRESIELAFVAALQHLPARQRAVLILRDVLGFSARETSEMLDTSAVSVDSALQRAHRSVEQRLPAESQQATLRSIGDERLSEIVSAYVDAWERSDIDTLVEMLTEDARITMPPRPSWFRGRDAVAAFLVDRVLRPGGRRRLVPVRANGSPAFGEYSWDGANERFHLHAITVLTFRGEQIEEISAFRDPEALEIFDVPAELPA